jgi:hypothetical protein
MPDNCISQGLQPNLVNVDLLASRKSYENLFDEVVSTSVVLDITSMPKRFFFIYLKKFLSDAKIKDFVVTYSRPTSYTEGALCGNMDPWSALNGFVPNNPEDETEAAQHIVINVGFMPDGLILNQSE